MINLIIFILYTVVVFLFARGVIKKYFGNVGEYIKNECYRLKKEKEEKLKNDK